MSAQTPVQQLLDAVEWHEWRGQHAPTGPRRGVHNTPGVLAIGDVRVPLYRLSDGTTVVDAADSRRLFGALLKITEQESRL